MDELTVLESLRPEVRSVSAEARRTMRRELFGDIPLTVDDPDGNAPIGRRSGRTAGESATSFDTRRAAEGKPRLLAMAASVALFALLGAVLLFAVGDQDSRGSSGSAPISGLFDDARGRIVYAHGTELRAVDPDDPDSAATIVDFASMAGVPPCDGCRGQAPVPVGWSPDGTELALDREYDGETFILDAGGTFTRISSEGGCCNFTGSNWLSPDGDSAAVGGGPTKLEVVDVDSGAVSASVELDPSRFPTAPGYGLTYYPTWSPDGTQLAFVADPSEYSADKPEILTFDLETGTTQDVVGPVFDLVRGLAWSPDGTELLAVASRDPAPSPRTVRGATGLYRIGLDGSPPRRIASGQFTVAVWSPDGTRIAALDDRDLVVMRADGSDERVVVTRASLALFEGLAWNPLPADQADADQLNRGDNDG